MISEVLETVSRTQKHDKPRFQKTEKNMINQARRKEKNLENKHVETRKPKETNHVVQTTDRTTDRQNVRLIYAYYSSKMRLPEGTT